ncbi:hypothetical protein Cgig2_019380 [Carnegiea gigantea]|uniref:Uncharacterized protein n=1 Tax=Carnegiea gigantea TaxID=171969 RepID=A0A9Q1KCK6_9CARY|nr:hypothetical protein Cgig2_019380 [Carnegiea gigantea]
MASSVSKLETARTRHGDYDKYYFSKYGKVKVDLPIPTTKLKSSLTSQKSNVKSPARLVSLRAYTSEKAHKGSAMLAAQDTIHVLLGTLIQNLNYTQVLKKPTSDQPQAIPNGKLFHKNLPICQPLWVRILQLYQERAMRHWIRALNVVQKDIQLGLSEDAISSLKEEVAHNKNKNNHEFVEDDPEDEGACNQSAEDEEGKEE